MTLQFKIDHDERFVSVRCLGVVVLQDILNYFNEVIVQNAAAYPKLFDATEAALRLSDDDMMVLGAWVSAYAAFDPRGPVGAVASAPETIDLFRRFMNLGGAHRPMRLFPSVREARVWLAEVSGRTSFKPTGQQNPRPGSRCRATGQRWDGLSHARQRLLEDFPRDDPSGPRRS